MFRSNQSGVARLLRVGPNPHLRRQLALYLVTRAQLWRHVVLILDFPPCAVFGPTRMEAGTLMVAPNMKIRVSIPVMVVIRRANYFALVSSNKSAIDSTP